MSFGIDAEITLFLGLDGVAYVFLARLACLFSHGFQGRIGFESRDGVWQVLVLGVAALLLNRTVFVTMTPGQIGGASR